MEPNSNSILDRFRELSSQRLTPLQASLELTNRCNERCTHCYLESFKDDASRVLSKQDWFKVIDELRDAGALYLILMGGEAMLSPYFWDILRYSSQKNFHVSMISNGLKINNQTVADELKKSGMSVITFSLYSLDPEIHDKMTSVKGSHVKTIRAIEYCITSGMQATVNALLTEDNAAGVFELYDWCEAKNLDMKVDPNITPKLNGDKNPLKFRATRETLLWFYRKRAERWPNGGPRPSLEVLDSHVCNAAKGKCAVTAYGELLPCIEIREPFGNLAKEKFKDIWYKNSKWRDLRVKDLSGYDNDLSLQNFCDHCPGAAKNEIGVGEQITSFTKMIAEVKRQVNLETQKLVKVEA